METTIMENQMEKKMENEMETREYIGLSQTLRALRRDFSAISRYILHTTPLLWHVCQRARGLGGSVCRFV